MGYHTGAPLVRKRRFHLHGWGQNMRSINRPVELACAKGMRSVISLIQHECRNADRMDFGALFLQLRSVGANGQDVMVAIRRLRNRNALPALDRPIGQTLPLLVDLLSSLDRDRRAQLTRQDVKQAKARGHKNGRPISMTCERINIAREMLRAGYQGVVIFSAVAAIAGPNLSRSAYFMWQKSEMSSHTSI